MKVKLIAQGTDESSLEVVLSEVAADGNFDRLDVAVAYATKQGLLTLGGHLAGFQSKLAGLSVWMTRSPNQKPLSFYLRCLGQHFVSRPYPLSAGFILSSTASGDLTTQLREYLS